MSNLTLGKAAKYLKEHGFEFSTQWIRKNIPASTLSDGGHRRYTREILDSFIRKGAIQRRSFVIIGDMDFCIDRPDDISTSLGIRGHELITVRINSNAVVEGISHLMTRMIELTPTLIVARKSNHAILSAITEAASCKGIALVIMPN